jgi:hypothetical protein
MIYLDKGQPYKPFAMKPFNILVILCMILSLGLNNVKAQEPQKISYQKISGITSISVRNLDTTKLAIITLQPDMATSKHNNQSLKKIKPYISNKSSFYDTGWFELTQLAIWISLLAVRGATHNK